MEVGAAAEIPVNTRSGEGIGAEGIGAFLLLHVFVDDLFPGSIGRPIFQ